MTSGAGVEMAIWGVVWMEEMEVDTRADLVYC